MYVFYSPVSSYLVGQIQPLLILKFLITRLRPDRSLARILSLTPEPDEQDDAEGYTIAHQDDNHTRYISGSIFGSKHLRSTVFCQPEYLPLFHGKEDSHDVPYTVGNEEHTRNRCLLCVTRHITGDETEQSDKRRGASLSEVVASQSSFIV